MLNITKVLVFAIFFIMLYGRCKSPEKLAAERKAVSYAMAKIAASCSKRVMLSLGMIGKATKEIFEYDFCPIDPISGNTVCSSEKSFRINFIPIMGLKIPNHETVVLNAARFSIVLEPPRNGDKSFVCWYRKGSPQHIVAAEENALITTESEVVFTFL
jgi:hypothetical protein